MELLNREMQRALLTRLAGAYPDNISAVDLEADFPGNTLRVNLKYLQELGLIEARFARDLEHGPVPVWAQINAAGIDFLQDDGGLSAILGVVTVKFHEDTLKALIESKIQASDLSQPDKQRFLDQLRSLPGETTKHLVFRLVDAGLDNWQKALPLLQSMFPG